MEWTSDGYGRTLYHASSQFNGDEHSVEQSVRFTRTLSRHVVARDVSRGCVIDRRSVGARAWNVVETMETKGRTTVSLSTVDLCHAQLRYQIQIHLSLCPMSIRVKSSLSRLKENLSLLKSLSTFEIVERRNRSMWKMFESIRIILKQSGREWNAEANAQSIQFVRQGTFPTDETGTTAAVGRPN